MMRKYIFVVALLVLVCAFGPRACARLWEPGAEADQGRMFHDLAQGKSARFLIRGAREIHLTSYFVIAKDDHPATRYTLKLAFLAGSGAAAEHRVAYLSVDSGTGRPMLPDGATLARARLLRVQAPPDTTILQVESPDGRVLLQAGWLTTRHPSREALLRRSGAPLFWFKSDELQQVRSQRFMSLPRLGEIPAVKLPLAAEQEADQNEDAVVKPLAPLRVGPHRALVFNVLGPGVLDVTLEQKGTFALDYLGVGGSDHAEFQDGHATLKLPEGPSSVILRPLADNASEVRLDSHKLRPIGGVSGILMPAERWANAWRLDPDRVLRFPIYAQKTTPGPVRITARALDGQPKRPLRWRFVDVHGHKLLDGLLPLDDQYDPFSAVLRDGQYVDLGGATKIFLVPPPGATALETSAESALVEVDVLLETGAQSELLPPYDIELATGLHWRDAATRAPRWLMLQPLTGAIDRRHLHAFVLRMPRIEERGGPATHGPWVSVKPRGAVLQAQIAEPSRHPVPEKHALSFLRTGQEIAVRVANKGRNAQRVVLSCDLSDKLGGKLALILDGRRVTSMPIATSTVRLEAPASAGVHRVRVRSPRHGRCVVEGHAPEEPTFVRRKVYLLPEKGTVRLSVTTKRRRTVPVHYAIYAEGAAASTTAAFSIKVDRGAPTRRVGSARTLTSGESQQKAGAAPLSVPIRVLNTPHTVWKTTEAVVHLGDELPLGRHRITLRALSPGRYWVRFWIPGKPHRHEGAESWIITDALSPNEAGE